MNTFVVTSAINGENDDGGRLMTAEEAAKSGSVFVASVTNCNLMMSVRRRFERRRGRMNVELNSCGRSEQSEE
jgi:hypothetical protein